jgi:hypothetical protein
MPIGSVGVAGVGVLAELPITFVGVTGGEMTPTLGVGGEIGRPGAPDSTPEAAVAAVAARTTTARGETKSIVLAARVCVSNPSIPPWDQLRGVRC